MSSELTIDIQLTELGFSSWGFQLLKQKENPQTHGPASALEDSTAPSSCSHVPEEMDLNGHSGSLVSPDSHKNAGETETDPAESERRTIGTDDDDDDHIVKDDAFPACEELMDIRRTNGNWEMDVAVNDDEDNEDEHSLTEEDDYGSSSDTNGLEEHRCHVCDLTFSTLFLLSEHLHVHTGVRPYCCTECGKKFCHLANYREHLRSHATFSCIICMARFATQELLQGHLDTNHFENEFYQCDFCKRIFVSLSECEEHVQAHKEEVRRHPCPQCDRSFHHQSSLHRHLKWHKKSALICTDCGQAFPKKNSLLRHSFSHLGLLPYTCTHCKQHFRLASLYRKHECKPEHIQCVACLVVFHNQSDFEKHKKDTGCWGHQVSSPTKTSDIRCMECGEIFSSSEDLKKHAGTHQRVMKCSECGMGFRSSLMLMSHMGGHAAVRPCLCKQCGLGFPHQHAYDSHLKTCGLDIPPKPSLKKSKQKALSTCKKEIIIAPKSKVPRDHEPQNEVSQNVLLRSVAPTSNLTKPPGVPWTLVLNKEHLPGNLPLVMILPTPVTSTSEGSQSSQNLVSSTASSEKRLPQSLATDIPLASTSQGLLASISNRSDTPLLLQGMTNPSANVVIPLTTTANSPKVRWASIPNMHTTINMLRVNAENEQKGTVLSRLEISKTLQEMGLVKTKPNLPSLSTAEAHNPEMPLCLVKVKTEPDDNVRNQTGSSSTLLEVKTHSSVLDSNRISGTPDISHIKKELNGSDLGQCEICGIILLEENMGRHIMDHSTGMDSTSGSSLLPLGPPSKRLNLG